MKLHKPMKILTLLLLPLVSFSQCPDDLWKHAVPINNSPVEVQMGKGQAVIVLLFERKDTTGTETWVVMKKGTTVPPTPLPQLKVEAEAASSLVNAAVVGTVVGHIRGDLPGGMVVKYAIDTQGRNKVRFRYSRGYTGNGTMVMNIGGVSNTLVFPSTGDWAKYVEIEFNVSGSGPVEITSKELGSVNFDYFIFL